MVDRNHTTYKNGDDWGMAYYYFNHITWHPMTAFDGLFLPCAYPKNPKTARQLEFFRMLVRQQSGLAIPRQN